MMREIAAASDDGWREAICGVRPQECLAPRELDSKNPIKTLYLPTFLLFSSLDTPFLYPRFLRADPS
jgi:hypothetical protein